MVLLLEGKLCAAFCVLAGFDLNICDKFGMAVADHAQGPLFQLARSRLCWVCPTHDSFPMVLVACDLQDLKPRNPTKSQYLYSKKPYMSYS